jgi:rfaE bifunctional protein nucleotidyltransferase chain/domain
MEKIEIIRSKILDNHQLAQKLAFWRFKNSKIVFTNGCFDVLHRGHIEYLAQARDKGDLLIVGLNTDASVRRMKGANRPINPQDARAMVLASLFFVDAVVLFDEDTPYNLIKTIQPNILIKGSDYAPENIVGYDIVTANGGTVETVDLVEGFSSTGIIEDLKL